MLAIFQRRLAAHEAHVLAGVLRSSGVPAYVWGENAAHFYGGLALGGCIVAVDEADLNEAAEVVKAVPDELGDQTALENGVAVDAGPPGILDLLCFGFMASLCAAGLMSALTAVWSFYCGVQGWAWEGIRTLIATLLAGIVWSILFAVGEGLMLQIVRGYRTGSLFCRLVFILAALVTMMALAFQA